MMIANLLTIQGFFGDNGAIWLGNWLPLSIFAVLASVFIYNILLMLARAFSVKELERFAESEMLQSAATAIMSIFLVMLVLGGIELAGSFMHGNLTCGGTAYHLGGYDDQQPTKTMDDAFRAIECRLQTKAVALGAIQQRILTDQDIADKFNALNEMWSIFGITVHKGDWNAQWYKEVETYRITNTLATTLLLGLDAQMAVLEYVRVNMLHIFLPLGILMRSFYFTRSSGALLMSLGIGMYFLFPVFFILTDPGFIPTPPEPPEPAKAPPAYCYPTMTSSVILLTTLEQGGAGSTDFISISSLRNDLSSAYISMILHPLVAFFLTMVFVRYMMTVLGGDTYELTKMITKVI